MGFKIWLNKGLYRIGDLYSDGVLMSFEQLVDKFGLPKNIFFQILTDKEYYYYPIKIYYRTPTIN